MVFVQQMQPEPEPEILELGMVRLIFEGNVDDRRTPSRVDQYLALINDAIFSENGKYSFYSNDRVVVMSNLSFELDSIVEVPLDL